MKPRDRRAITDWERYRKATAQSTVVDLFESELDKAARIERHRTDFTAFAKYHFPRFATADFAPFQLDLVRAMDERQRGLFCNIVARDHAKSAVAMMLILWLMCKGEARTMLLASWSLDSARNLLTPFRIQLESNERLKHDYGPFQSPATQWEADNFTTANGWSFRAVGSGQSPRGARNEEARPDIILADDFDEDEQSRNPKRVREAFDWLMGALFAAMSITGRGRFLITGNIIAKDTVIAKAEQKADWSQRVNIFDKNGNPSWPQRFTKEECDYMIAKLGYRLSQREYFNNPIAEGTVFKEAWLQAKRTAPVRKYKALIAYLDPGFKKTKTSDTKAWVLVGLLQGEYHILRAFVDQATVNEMIGWGYELHEYVTSNGGALKMYMEEVFLQDLLYEDFRKAAVKRNKPLPVRGDKRKKPDKDARIEALSGHFERGDIWFSEQAMKEAGMQTLKEQFLDFEVGVKTRKDGPDAVEGAIHLLQQAAMAVKEGDIIIGKRAANKFRA